MFAAIMTDPFAMSQPATLSATIKALEATMTSCWPRIANRPWQDEITKMLVICWLNFQDNTNKAKDMEAELVRAAGILAAIMKAGEVDVASKISPLVAKEPLLQGLFSHIALT